MALVALISTTFYAQSKQVVIIIVAILAFILLSLMQSRLWARLDTRIGTSKTLRSSLYVEFYRRDGRSHISVFRHVYNWHRGRWEIYGAPMEIKRSDAGASAGHPILREWRSVTISEDASNTGRRSAFYFYRSSEPEITGITRMFFDTNRQKGNGFFCDIRNVGSVNTTVNFNHYRVSANKNRSSPHNRPQLAELKRTLRAGRRYWADQSFQDEVAPKIVEYILRSEEMLELMFDDSLIDDLREERDRVLQTPSASGVTEVGEDQILDQLAKLLPRAYARYSGLAVAAAVVDETDKPHFGVNVENVAFPLGTCAEEAAIGAFRAGGGNRISKVFVASSAGAPISPCGGCRQRLWEFGGPSCEICLVEGNAITLRQRLGDLIPGAFDIPN
jgi:cytidine deaminase